MAVNFKVIPSDNQFHSELVAAGPKLVVVDFHATWLEYFIFVLVLSCPTYFVVRNFVPRATT